MNDRLAAALGDIEAHQKLMNERMAGFVEQLRGLVSQSQTETNQTLQAILTDIGEAVRAQISALKEQGIRRPLRTLTARPRSPRGRERRYSCWGRA